MIRFARRMRRASTIAPLAASLALAVAAASCVSADQGEWSSKGRSASTKGGKVTSQPVPTGSAAAQPSAVRTTYPESEVAQAPTASPPPESAPSPGVEVAVVPAAPLPAVTPVEVNATDATSLRATALTLLDAACRSPSPLMRAHAIEALSAWPPALDRAATRGLVDENRGVRFVAAMAIARGKRCEVSYLAEPLLRDQSASVRAGAIAALAVCGKRVDQSPLATMVNDETTEVRANAYWAIGVIGNRSAVGLVRDSVGRGLTLTDPVRVRIVELQAAECLVHLGEIQEIEPIRAALFAPVEQGELTALACQMVGRLKDERSKPMLERLLNASGDQVRPPELRIAAADALARLGGSDRAILMTILEPYVSAPEASLRAQCATALGAVGSRDALPALARLLNDPDPVVRVAAAGAILVLTPTA